MDFLNEESLTLYIENMVMKDNINYIDAVCEYCEKNDIEVKDIKHILSKNIIAKIKNDAMNLGFLKKEAKLPI